MIATIARHQVLSLRRQRVSTALLGAMVVVTVLAGILGWSSQHTIVRVYDEAVKLLASTGQPAPPNPFLLKPTLSLLSNMVVYIPLIGALLALILGHLSIVDDRSNATGRLVFSRQVTRTQYALGKMLGSSAVLAVILLASAVVSTAAVVLVNGSITGPDSGRIGLYYLISWAYLLPFVLLGMITVMLTSRRSMALLSALGTWLAVTFVIPQFTSGLRPTQSLNPLSEPVGTSQTFFQITRHAQPLSVAEQYKSSAGVVLQTAPTEPVADTLLRLLPIVGLSVVLITLVLVFISKHDFSRSANHE